MIFLKQKRNYQKKKLSMADCSDVLYTRQTDLPAGSPEKDSQPVAPSNDRKSSQRVLRDMTNPKSRLLESCLGGRTQEGRDRDLNSRASIPKQDLQKIRIELCKRIQQEKGRSRIENLLFFEKIEKKEQGDIMLQAKTILLSIKANKDRSSLDRCPPLQAKPVKRISSKPKVNKSQETELTYGMTPPLDKHNKTQNLNDRSFKSLFEPSPFRRSDVTAIIERNPLRDDSEEAPKGVKRLNHIQIRTMSKLLIKKKDSSNQSSEQVLRIQPPLEKLDKYRQFLGKINYANRIIIQPPAEYQKKLIYYLGKGNNSMLIKSLMKRRFWWTEGPMEQANFVWTQLKKPEVLARQPEFNEQAPYQFVSQSLSAEQSSRSVAESPKINKSRGSICFTGEDKILYGAQFNDYCKNGKPRTLRKVQPKLAHNHFSGNCHLGNKKALYFNLRHYCSLTNKPLNDIVPLTFHLGDQYRAFEREFKRRAQIVKDGNSKVHNIWIVKPGENSNRGNNIRVIKSLQELDTLLAEGKKHANGEKFTYIVQLYMNRPFLYNKRKFDIRHYMLITSIGNCKRAYWYREGYIRTSSVAFDLEDKDNAQIHLTNDAIQKHSETYGKYEQANKLSYSEFQRYLDMQHKDKKYNFTDVLLKMKDMAAEAVRATFLKLETTNREFNFEIFGLDFMLDQNLKPWLIEVNTNPCLQLSSNLLGRIIPNMVEHAFRMCLDSLFPPPLQYPANQRHFLPNKAQQHLKFQVMFNSDIQGPALAQLFRNGQQPELGNIEEQDEQFQNEGNQINFVQ